MTFEEFSKKMPRRLAINADGTEKVCVISYANEIGQYNYAMCYIIRNVDADLNTKKTVSEVIEYSEISLRSLFNQLDEILRIDEE